MAGHSKPSNSSSMRVLIRSPPPVSTASPPPPQPSQNNPSLPLPSPSSPSTSVDPSKSSNNAHRFPRPSRSSSSPPPPPPHPPPSVNTSPDPPIPKGVVVVGFIGLRDGDVSQLINRLIDSDIFGSSNRQKSILTGEEKVTAEKDWFERRKIGYYHDQEKGIVYLNMCFSKCLGMIADCGSVSNLGIDSVLEEHEFGDLQGMLFMFTVCHVIIYIQEGSLFDVETLKKFRILQSAKHALAPFIRSRMALSPSMARSSSSSTSTSTSTPGRRRGISNRSSSGLSPMSGLGLHTSLFPGQCTPVTLFVFVDDFSDLLNSCASVEDVTDTYSGQSPVLTNFMRSGNLKGHGPVVVLARPGNKDDGGSRKKLQSALEGQIRFLIKKCRALSGSDYSHSCGSKSGYASASIPLLTLDASRTVVLLDRFANQGGESLDYACGLVEDVLNGKATSDSPMFERQGQVGNKDDISSLKDFISRQVDILRGRGGLVASGNSSAGGAGMVAVAAAIAAASVTSGKTTSAPELPSFEDWLSSVHVILKGILCAKRGCIDESEVRRKKFRQKKGVPPQAEGSSSRGGDPLDIAVSILEGGSGINSKFSTQWCLKALPSAMDIYLKDLPDLYTTSKHEAHLEKALCAFCSMAKGPAVQQFMKKLEEKCTSVWKSGRQLCDTVSLTGKPCMHQKHDVEDDDMPFDHVKEPHCSGYVYLHACACGRSRQLRQDPFDFQTANITFNCFPECDKLVPGLLLPKVCGDGSNQQPSWFVIRISGSKDYDPYKGLNQSGFGGNQKFLMKWTILIEDDNQINGLFVTSAWNGSLSSTGSESRHEINTDVSFSVGTSGSLHTAWVESQRSALDHSLPDDKSINFGNGLPNIHMKKPFSEVVAGSSSGDLAFPPLQPKRQSSASTGKGGKRIPMKDGASEHMDMASDYKKAWKAEMVPSALENQNGKKAVRGIEGSPCVKIGSNVIPLYLNDNNRSARFNPPVKHVLVYVGFEHECPHGHRFILSTELLDELGVPTFSSNESHVPSCVNAVDSKFQDVSSSGQNSSHIQTYQSTNGGKTSMDSKIIRLEKSGALGVDGVHSVAGVFDFPKSSENQNLISFGVGRESDLVSCIQQSCRSVKLDDGGQAFSLLNRNLPIYLNCIHCKTHKNKKDQRSTAKFAGSISQLQRIFVVTPPFPVVLSTNPVVQFECSFQSLDGLNSESQLEFSLRSQVILPPESFVSIRLPFVYGVQLENKCLAALKPFEEKPELTAWVKHGTAVNLVSIGSLEKSLPAR